MKKYLLTALLWVFGLFGFASAYTLDWFTSDSEISNCSDGVSISIESSDKVFLGADSEDFVCLIVSPVYSLSSSYSDNQYFSFVSSNVVCSNTELYNLDNDYIKFDWDLTSLTAYCSTSQMTYSSSSSGWDSDSSPLLSGWTTVFSGIISSLGSAVSEFIPYVVYIWIWLLGAIIWFVAIKRLINRIRAKIFGTFNSRRKR